MLRWVGSQKHLYPSEKLYEIEEAIGLVDDVQRSWRPSLYIAMRPQEIGHPEGFNKTEEGQELIKSMRQKWIENELPQYLKHLSDMIDKNGGKWLVAGDSPTIADCHAVPMLRNFTKGHIDYVDPNCLSINPKIVDYVERFCALPEIKGRYDKGVGSGN